MKKFLLGLAAGIILGGTGIAVAASSYWSNKGQTYTCTGGPISVICKETNWKPSYEVAIIPGAIDVAFQGHVIFNCKRGIRPSYNCEYYGR